MFHHIYVETKAFSYPQTETILKRFSSSVQIEISHYKDVFNRCHQSFSLQKMAPALILACKEDNFVYSGAPVCQNFDHPYFYYTSCVMNCIFDCEYCYLQGMYPSANLVVFVNLEDIFKEVEELLKHHPVYLCISYDTDLLALEGILYYCKKWLAFTKFKPLLTIELRTKCADSKALKELIDSANQLIKEDDSIKNRFIFAFTLSPDIIQTTFEHKTASLKQRLKAVQFVALSGFPVRLCFDPIIYIENWKLVYYELVEQIFAQLSEKDIKDISIGTFRVSKDYLKRMRKQRTDSSVLQFPYENEHGVFHYGTKLGQELLQTICGYLKTYIPQDKIFMWEGIK